MNDSKPYGVPPTSSPISVPVPIPRDLALDDHYRRQFRRLGSHEAVARFIQMQQHLRHLILEMHRVLNVDPNK
jgi:hypothetical protein